MKHATLWRVPLHNDGSAPALNGEPLESAVTIRADDQEELEEKLEWLRNYYPAHIGWTVGEPEELS